MFLGCARTAVIWSGIDSPDQLKLLVVNRKNWSAKLIGNVRLSITSSEVLKSVVRPTPSVEYG